MRKIFENILEIKINLLTNQDRNYINEFISQMSNYNDTDYLNIKETFLNKVLRKVIKLENLFEFE